MTYLDENLRQPIKFSKEALQHIQDLQAGFVSVNSLALAIQTLHRELYSFKLECIQEQADIITKQEFRECVVMFKQDRDKEYTYMREHPLVDVIISQPQALKWLETLFCDDYIDVDTWYFLRLRHHTKFYTIGA